MKSPGEMCAAAIVLGLSLATAAAQAPDNERAARAMRLAKFVVPEFPEFLRRSGVMQGTVVAAIGHDAEGRPADILVIESTDPRFSAAVLEAIRGWRFESPAKPPLPREAVVPVVRFLFTSGTVAVISLDLGAPGASLSRVRANTPIELPNFSHLDTVPRPVQQPMPKVAAGRDGIALVKFFVDATGRARVPIVIDATTPELGEAALAAVRQWRFDPPQIDGKPVIAIETRLFRFGTAAKE